MFVWSIFILATNTRNTLPHTRHPHTHTYTDIDRTKRFATIASPVKSLLLIANCLQLLLLRGIHLLLLLFLPLLPVPASSTMNQPGREGGRGAASRKCGYMQAH